MNCHELTELLLEFLDNELPEDFCARIREHLARCPPCVVYLETYRITIKLSSKLRHAPPPLPTAFAQRLQAMLCQPPPPPAEPHREGDGVNPSVERQQGP